MNTDLSQTPGSTPTGTNYVTYAEPHTVPAFWRLFGAFKQQSRPLALDRDALGGDPDHDNVLAYETLPEERAAKMRVFDEMDRFGLPSSIFDLFAEESTQIDYDRGVRVWIEAKDQALVREAEAVLATCEVEERLFAITRRMCKYGDAFQRLMYSNAGVLSWRRAASANVERIEDRYNRLIGFKEAGARYRESAVTGGREVSFPWDYVHGRLLGKNEVGGYGTGMGEAWFREWRNLVLAEDAMVMYRLRRAPDRNMVFVDVGSLSDPEAAAYTNKWRQAFRKNVLVDPASPQYRTNYNPLTPLEDIFIPTRKDGLTRVETLSGAGNIGEVFDIDHLRNVFFGSASLPQAWFGFEGEINAKATLQQQDIRTARKLKRVRSAQIKMLRQLIDVHFTLIRGRSAEDDTRFDVSEAGGKYMIGMSPISFLEEQERVDLLTLRYTLVQTVAALAPQLQVNPRVWASYVLIAFAKLSEDLVLRLVSTIPEKPTAGAGPGFESLDKETRAAILDHAGHAAKGFTSMSKEEVQAIAKAVHTSPQLRALIANFAELNEEAQTRTARQQTDSSLLPVVGATYTEVDAQRIELNEDIAVLKKQPTTRLDESKKGGESRLAATARSSK